jgi:antagonist of KipI
MGALRIVKPGPLLTIQDLGRPGWGRFGVSPSGALDPLAARAANALAGNAPGAPLLEITGRGGEIAFEDARRVGLAGADLGAEIVGAGAAARDLPPFRGAAVAGGDVLRLRERRAGARAYLAVRGGVVGDAAFGSAASDLAGGLGGRPLRAGDRVALGDPGAGVGAPDAAEASLASLRVFYADPERLRFVPAASAPAGAVAALAAAPFAVTPRSNRTGYELDGPTLAMGAAADLLSEPIAPGAIQVPPDGRPILLMADRQTVGGYPVVGYLARADVPKAAQLWPGDRVRFAAVSVEDAQAAAREQDAALALALAAAAP